MTEIKLYNNHYVEHVHSERNFITCSVCAKAPGLWPALIHRIDAENSLIVCPECTPRVLEKISKKQFTKAIFQLFKIM